VDKFVGISDMSKGYIAKYYNREAEVIFCPVDVEFFRPRARRGDHYLLVSRLEAWKKVEYAIEAFNVLGLPLRVIGTGPEEARLRALAKSNIEFLGAASDEELAVEYSTARAVIFTPYLEYGLIPLEANACGTPVIAYGRGGITETMIPVDEIGNGGTPTAVFFYEQNATALIAAVNQFQKLEFLPDALVRHAQHWSVPEFKRRIRQVVSDVATPS
jgi:glycosyltransferase involved in cell wall biosynthesis